jgi:uncharacterized membrane protein
MPSVGGGIGNGASIVLVGAMPFLLHRLTLGATPGWLVGTVAATQVTAILWLVLAPWASRTRILLTVAAFTIMIAALWLLNLPPRRVGLAAAGFSHAAAYLGLLAWFALSLRPGREPAITSLARRVRPTMPDKVVRYTRAVTVAWCAFCAAQLAASAGLLLAAPEAVWSAFVNLANVPLIAAMALAEFGFRRVYFRHESRTGLLDTIRAMRHGRGMSGKRS